MGDTCMYLLFKEARNLTVWIPLKNGESTGNAQWLPDSSGIPVEPEYLSRCDDKQIVIDNDGMLGVFQRLIDSGATVVVIV